MSTAKPKHHGGPAARLTRRSRRYLRASVALLTVALSIVVCVLAVAEHQRREVHSDFRDNPRLHTIGIAYGLSTASQAGLSYQDLASVRDLLARKEPRAHTTVIGVYGLGVGLISDSSVPLFLFGVDHPALVAKILDIPQMRDDVAYMARGLHPPSDAEVPVEIAQKDGYTSNRTATTRLSFVADVEQQMTTFVFGANDGGDAVTPLASFERVAEQMLGGSWQSIIDRSEHGKLVLTPLVSNVVVYVSSLDDVKPVASTLDRAGYSTSYTLQAFGNLPGALSTETKLALAIALLALLGAVGLVAVVWNSYFTLSRRDIGILKHFGYSNGAIRMIYGRQLRRSFGIVGLIIVPVTVLAALIALGTGGLGWALANVAVVVCVLVGVYLLLVRALLSRQLKTGVLELLKLERQFQ